MLNKLETLTRRYDVARQTALDLYLTTKSAHTDAVCEASFEQTPLTRELARLADLFHEAYQRLDGASDAISNLCLEVGREVGWSPKHHAAFATRYRWDKAKETALTGQARYSA